jgi:ribosomal protein S18 acetylase RimI-like enzyme
MGSIKIRTIRREDIDKIIEIENAAWGIEKAATKEMLLSRLEVFPEGFFCAEVDGEICGFSTQEIIRMEDFPDKDKTWNLLTDNGFLKRSHNSKGDALFGVSMSVPQYVSDKNVALTLYEYCGKLAIKFNLKKIYVGSRIPKYYKHQEKMSVEEYVHGRSRTGRILDPELALYVNLGLKIEKISPNYFKDPESLDYGVLMSWTNPFYPVTRYLPMLTKILSRVFSV